MPRTGQYIWNYYRCAECHDYLVTIRAVEGNVPDEFKCQTKDCRGMQKSAMEAPVVDWPVTIKREAIAEWYRPPLFELRKMERTHAKLHEAITQAGRLIMRKLDEPMQWSDDNDGYPKAARFSLT